jgi:hypothetical protein
MDHQTRTGAPVHLWIVGVLALLWNGFGGYDYLMTRTRGTAYIEQMMPGYDSAAIMDYINSFPIWASAGWGLGVWGGLLGAILLLMRHRHAVTAFALSMIGAIVGLGYQLVRPMPIKELNQGYNGYMPYIIIAVAIGLFLYARAQRTKGVLR